MRESRHKSNVLNGMIAYALSNKGSRSAYFAATRDIARQRMIDARKILMGVEDMHEMVIIAEVNSHSLELRLCNGSSIVFKSACSNDKIAIGRHTGVTMFDETSQEGAWNSRT